MSISCSLDRNEDILYPFLSPHSSLPLPNWSDGKDVVSFKGTKLFSPMAVSPYIVVIKVLNGYEAFSNDALIIHVDH
jgi:hypothetical protein